MPRLNRRCFLCVFCVDCYCYCTQAFHQQICTRRWQIETKNRRQPETIYAKLSKQEQQQ